MHGSGWSSTTHAIVEGIHESDCVHRIRPTGRSSAQRGRKTCSEGQFGLTILLYMVWASMIGGKKAILMLEGARPASEKTKDLIFPKELIEAEKLQPGRGASEFLALLSGRIKFLPEKFVQHFLQQWIFSLPLQN